MRCLQCKDLAFRTSLCRKHYDIKRFSKRDRCIQLGCTNKSRHNNLCVTHYRRACVNSAVKCSALDCDKGAEKRGLCGNHYQYWRRQNNNKICSNEGCNNKVFKFNMCFAHWKQHNPYEYFMRALKTRITNTINRKYRKISHTEEVLGASLEQVRLYIESHLLSGMTWGNYGHSGWTIDHICPCAQAQNEEELLKLQHHTNLIPMWFKDNLNKRDNATPEALDKCREILRRDWVYNKNKS